jgi:hypothetical protein
MIVQALTTASNAATLTSLVLTIFFGIDCPPLVASITGRLPTEAWIPAFAGTTVTKELR